VRFAKFIFTSMRLTIRRHCRCESCGLHFVHVQLRKCSCAHHSCFSRMCLASMLTAPTHAQACGLDLRPVTYAVLPALTVFWGSGKLVPKPK
jgi:hypothetical protein